MFTVGCGEVTGATLISWKSSDGMTWIDPSWLPASMQKYRSGWCWVKDLENEISCYILVENEPKEPGIDNGSVSLRLAFKDVILWPTLGNDFTNSIHNKNSQLRRIIASQSEDPLKRPNLIMASQHIIEVTEVLKSLLDYYAQRLVSPIAVSVANSGRLQNCRMQLYSATGIFPQQISNILLVLVRQPCSLRPRDAKEHQWRTDLTLTWDANLTLKRAKGHRLQDGEVRDDLVPAALEFHELLTDIHLILITPNQLGWNLHDLIASSKLEQ